jgi:Transposase IS116/IS110/IS902 family
MTRFWSGPAVLVRLAGLYVTVSESDDKCSPGPLSRQGAPILRWAAYEAALSACRRSSPTTPTTNRWAHASGTARAMLTIARRPLRRCYHTLIVVGNDLLAPFPEPETHSVPLRASCPSNQPMRHPAGPGQLPLALCTGCPHRRHSLTRPSGRTRSCERPHQPCGADHRSSTKVREGPLTAPQPKSLARSNWARARRRTPLRLEANICS